MVKPKIELSEVCVDARGNLHFKERGRVVMLLESSLFGELIPDFMEDYDVYNVAFISKYSRMRVAKSMFRRAV